MKHKRPEAVRVVLEMSTRSRALRGGAIAQLKRKRLTLDQNRIDLLKALLGVKTDTEAITAAMDLTLEMAAFSREVGAGSRRLLGKGGFVNRFDDEASLDFSGFSL
jgi:hypothetical protein